MNGPQRCAGSAKRFAQAARWCSRPVIRRVGHGGGTRELTFTAVDVPEVGPVESWEEVFAVDGELVTFRSMTAFRRDETRIESTSTLRFRERSAVEQSLVREGFDLVEVRDASDRPGREMVFFARRAI